MKYNQILQEEQEAIRLEDTIDSFFSDFQVGRLLNGAGIRKLRGTSPLKIATVFSLLTDDEREKVLIFDSSTYDRSRSKKVELLAWVFDHPLGKSLRGFNMLTLGWSDGFSFIPLDFALGSSANKKSRIQDIRKIIDKRTCGYRRRMEAVCKTTDLLSVMLKRVLAAGITADYILMDSWFCFPAVIATLSRDLPVICMLKNMHRVFYKYEGQ